MNALKAKRSILYQGRMYDPGAILPAGDEKMVDAWLAADSAEWAGEGQKPVQEAQGELETDNNTQGVQEAEEGTLDVVDGRLTCESLETMTKADLEKLARDMGVEIPRGATKALIIERLAAVPVEAPVHDEGAQ